jgi:hypothetical protein
MFSSCRSPIPDLPPTICTFLSLTFFRFNFFQIQTFSNLNKKDIIYVIGTYLVWPMKKGCRREGLRPALKRQVGAPAMPPWERNMVIYLWVGTTEDFFGQTMPTFNNSFFFIS